MAKVIKIKKGVDIKLVGPAEKKVSQAQRSSIHALMPDDFTGIVPKMLVKEGAEVMAGTPIFCDKSHPEILFTSPVSGEMVEIKRGPKRVIEEIKILADKETKYESFPAWNGGSRESLIASLLQSGLWVFIQQRPYGIIANPKDQPKNIFVSGFDTAPLAADIPFILQGDKAAFQSGIDALAKLTAGKVYLGIPSGDTFYNDIKNVEKVAFSGPHPSGNVGVQIHHIQPINKGEVVWTVNAIDVALIGKSLKAGQFIAERIVALAGSKVSTPQYYRTLIGASITSIAGTDAAQPNVRAISGNVLTGTQSNPESYLGFYNSTLSIIPEGNHKKFFLTEGWLAPGFSRFSISHAYPSWLLGNKRYDLDTNLNGEKRAFVVTGELERVFPFDIYPMQLLKSIMVNDIDAMEKLGIYEVLPEDFALCEVVCTSKIEIQSVVKKGLEDMRKEFSH